MTHITSITNSILGLQSVAQSASSLSAAGTRVQPDVVEQSIVFQRISSLSSRQFAVKDTSNAIGFIQSTDNALFQVTSNLLELRLLAQNASNLTLTAAQSSSLVTQANTLKASLDTIASSTVIAGKNILDGSVDNVSFQVGISADQSVNISGFNVKTTALGSLPGFLQTVGNRVQLSDVTVGTQGIQEGNASTGDINSFNIIVKDFKLAETINIAESFFGGAIKSVSNTANLTNRGSDNFASGLAKSIAERITVIRNNGNNALSDLTATALTQFTASDVVSADFSGTVDNTKSTSIGVGTLNSSDFLINGVNIGEVIVTANDSSGGLVRAINDKSSISGVFAAVDSQGQLQLSAYDGRDIVISTANVNISNTLFGAGANRFSEKFSDLRVSGQVTLSSDKTQAFSGADIRRSGFDNFSLTSTESSNTLSTGNIFRTDFSSTASAELAIGIIDSALSQVASFRSSLSLTLDTVSAINTDPFARIKSQQEAQELADQVNSQVTQLGSSDFLGLANTNAQQALLLLN